MIRNGWKIDLPYPEFDDPYSAYQTCGGDSFFGYPGAARTGTMSAVFRNAGSASLTIGNCRDLGTIIVSLNEKQIKSISAETKATVNFAYQPRDVLELKTDDDAIIKLYNLEVSCEGA